MGVSETRQGGISRGHMCLSFAHFLLFHPAASRNFSSHSLPILPLPPASRYFISFCFSSLLQPLPVFSVWSTFITHLNASIRTSPYHFFFISSSSSPSLSPHLHSHFRWKFYSSFASLIPKSLEKNNWLNFLQTQWNKQFLENWSEFSSEKVEYFEELIRKVFHLLEILLR